MCTTMEPDYFIFISVPQATNSKYVVVFSSSSFEDVLAACMRASGESVIGFTLVEFPEMEKRGLLKDSIVCDSRAWDSLMTRLKTLCSNASPESPTVILKAELSVSCFFLYFLVGPTYIFLAFVCHSGR
jgi:hypothetical protein